MYQEGGKPPSFKFWDRLYFLYQIDHQILIPVFSRPPDQIEYMQQRRKAAQSSMKILFEYCQETGEFKEYDIQAMALTVLLLLDSLEVNANVLSITEEEIDQQLQIICDLVIKI